MKDERSPQCYVPLERHQLAQLNCQVTILTWGKGTEKYKWQVSLFQIVICIFKKLCLSREKDKNLSTTK